MWSDKMLRNTKIQWLVVLVAGASLGYSVAWVVPLDNFQLGFMR
jgi:hypothetical protein